VRCVVVVPWIFDAVVFGPLRESSDGVDTDTYKAKVSSICTFI